MNKKIIWISISICIILSFILYWKFFHNNESAINSNSSILLSKEGSVETLLPNSTNTCGVIDTIESYAWIIIRSDYKEKIIHSYENEIIDESNTILSRHDKDDIGTWFDTCGTTIHWIRIIREPFILKEGQSGLSSKDYLLYEKNGDVFFCIQDPLDTDIWTIIALPQKGSWLDTEIDILFRMNFAY